MSQHHRSSRLIPAALLLSLIFAAPLTSAATPAPAPVDPRVRVEVVYKEILEAAQKAPDQKTLTTAVTTELEGFVDYPAFAERTLKRSWPKLTAAQRALFMERFRELIIQTYAKRFKPQSAFLVSYRGDVLYKGADKAEAKVRTTIKSDRVAADVDYYMSLVPAKAGAGAAATWQAYDFEIDGASMALSWRRQFERIIESDGFDRLIEKIDAKIGDESDSDDIE